jgi:hypothetical protein
VPEGWQDAGVVPDPVAVLVVVTVDPTDAVVVVVLCGDGALFAPKILANLASL